MFITIDGGDGSGKGRQIELIRTWFEDNNVDFAFFRDPGDTALGESIRSLLLERHDLSICSKSELALFMASRAQLVAEKIWPALQEGKIVLVDRYLLSTVVYQGYAVGADEREIAQIWNIGQALVDNVMQDLTFVLDCSADIAFQRLNRAKDRIESRSSEYHSRVEQGYRDAVQNWRKWAPGEAFLIDATAPPETVFEKIRTVLEMRLS
ncbi:MAG: dTMP kinase [Thermoguttaceae bacterium]|nr:dTMP kinase [Thermoguttaceae bacterium]